MIQSFGDEFYAMSEKKCVTTDNQGNILVRYSKYQAVSKINHTFFRAGVGKLLHMNSLSHTKIKNDVRESPKNCSGPNKAHIKAMKICMGY